MESSGVRVKMVPGSVLLLFVQMAVLDAPPQRETGTVERGKAGVRAQRFLDVLQGAFQLTWERPEELRQAMSELSTSEEAKAGLFVLWEYLEVLGPSLSSMWGVEAAEGEGEGGAARQAEDRRKRRKRGSRSNTSGGGVGDLSEGSVDEEEETTSEQRRNLSPAAIGQDKERGMRGAEEAGAMVSGDGGVKVVRAVVRAGVPSSSCSMTSRRETSVQRALANKDLLGCVLKYVGGKTRRRSVVALGKVALVSRSWREVATGDALWKGIEEELMPALWREEHRGKRGQLVQYGRMLLAERRVWGEDNWRRNVELQVEIFDPRNGLQMLLARGPVVCKVKEGANEVVIGFPDWSPAVRGPPFSTARMDPEGRFSNILGYLRHFAGVCVRVTVRDRRTGKGGLLWEDGWGTVRACEDPDPYWEQRLPEGTHAVISGARSMVGGPGDGLECYTEFFVCPQPDQAGVAERDKQYCVATEADLFYGSDEEDADYPFSLKVVGTDIARVRTTIRALC